MEAVKNALDSGQYDVVVMEEGAMAEKFGIISTGDILEMIRNKPDKTELIITGRGASEKLIAAADLVTEMKEIKHYYQAGVKARRGIEH
jgi:cob(I)alamin adenosyltransferase